LPRIVNAALKRSNHPGRGNRRSRLVQQRLYDNLREFQSGLTRVEEGFSPATNIEDFDPSSRELRARVLTSARRDAVFVVSEDGERVQLKSLRLHTD
jgi:hypothetical protein